jgi:L-histidine N-alpha-methyltransferase
MTTVEVTIHASQFPGAVRNELLHSLRARQVNHKFHYDSVKQAQRWVAVHKAFSPAATDEDCARTYDAAFAGVISRIPARTVHVVGLGCGSGAKDARLLGMLRRARKQVAYTPLDTSVPLVMTAREAALEFVRPEDCRPMVCDLAAAEDLPALLDARIRPADTRLITFFGMIPNFEPNAILPRLSGLLRREDHMLFSANLAPGQDYDAGVTRILAQYDNDPTRDWLMTFLLDLGVEKTDGQLRFVIEGDPGGGAFKRVAAYFHFSRARRLEVDENAFEFRPADTIRLFFSYRHDPDRMSALLSPNGISVMGRWISKSEEEGVFLCGHG